MNSRIESLNKKRTGQFYRRQTEELFIKAPHRDYKFPRMLELQNADSRTTGANSQHQLTRNNNLSPKYSTKHNGDTCTRRIVESSEAIRQAKCPENYNLKQPDNSRRLLVASPPLSQKTVAEESSLKGYLEPTCGMLSILTSSNPPPLPKKAYPVVWNRSKVQVALSADSSLKRAVYESPMHPNVAGRPPLLANSRSKAIKLGQAGVGEPTEYSLSLLNSKYDLSHQNKHRVNQMAASVKMNQSRNGLLFLSQQPQLETLGLPNRRRPVMVVRNEQPVESIKATMRHELSEGRSCDWIGQESQSTTAQSDCCCWKWLPQQPQKQVSVDSIQTRISPQYTEKLSLKVKSLKSLIKK